MSDSYNFFELEDGVYYYTTTVNKNRSIMKHYYTKDEDFSVSKIIVFMKHANESDFRKYEYTNVRLSELLYRDSLNGLTIDVDLTTKFLKEDVKKYEKIRAGA